MKYEELLFKNRVQGSFVWLMLGWVSLHLIWGWWTIVLGQVYKLLGSDEELAYVYVGWCGL